MPPKEAIKNWLADFDSIIERHAADPVVVKQDRLLRDLFELAFPPQDLPPEIEFSSEEGALKSSAIVQAHHPYYLATTTTTKKTTAETGETRLVVRQL